jgi:Icc-related predicted phosphoesterase
MSHRRQPVKIAGLGDLHVAETSAGAWRELFEEISTRAEVLALCGDLTNLGAPREAEILAGELSACRIPVVGVLGNHDHECGQPEEVTRILHDAGVFFLEGQAIEIQGIGFAGAKGFAGGFGARTLSAFGEPAIKQFVAEGVDEAVRLETPLRALGTERSVVVLHYAPVAATAEGEPKEIFPFLGSSRLAETIDRFAVSAILHGHAHLGTYAASTEKGIPVYNCARSARKPSGRPYALIEI